MPKYKDWNGWPLEAFLRVCYGTGMYDCIHFANDPSLVRMGYGGIYIGSFVVDESVKSSAIPRVLKPRNIQKQNAPFVQRERHNAIIRDGEKRYRINGATLK